MPAGMEIINNNNNVLVDGNYRNMALVESGTLTLSNQIMSNGAPNLRNGSLIRTGRNKPVVAFICSASVYTNWHYSSGSWRFWFTAISDNPIDVQFFIFDTVEQTSSTFGCQVFNETGSLVFDALFPYMRIIDFVTGDYSALGGQSGSGITKTYSGKKVAILQAAYCITTFLELIPGPIGQEDFFRVISCGLGKSNSNSSVNFIDRRVSRDGPYPYNANPPFPWQQYYSWLIIDVTNL